jgi:hypothetical protein
MDSQQLMIKWETALLLMMQDSWWGHLALTTTCKDQLPLLTLKTSMCIKCCLMGSLEEQEEWLIGHNHFRHGIIATPLMVVVLLDVAVVEH